ncbi:MAG: GNAT family N-acetyltransferase [Acidimicrobiales bacterium]
MSENPAHMNTGIRPVADADLDEILAHNNAAVPAVNSLTRADLERFVEIAHSFLVIEAPDRTRVEAIAGFLIGLGPGADYDSLNYAWFSERYGSFVYVDRVVVAASGRGAGVGTRLYEEFARRGRDDAAPVMLAEVNIVPRNDISLAFHEARRFRSVGEQDTEGGTKRVTLLEKRLFDVRA